MMKKKGIKFGAKKVNDLDAFIEDEFNKIQKQRGPALGGGTGEQNDQGENEVDYSRGGSVINSGLNSNFDSTPQNMQKKIGVSSKPIFGLKKSQIRKAGGDPLISSSNNMPYNVEDSGRMDDQFTPGQISGQNQMPTNIGATPIGLSKPNLISNKAVLPAQIKPFKVLKGKKPFVMAPPDAKDSGMYNLKKREEDEVVDSLQLNEGRNSQMYGGIQSSGNHQLKTNVKDVQLGPQKNILLVKKNLEDSKIHGKRPDSSQKQNKTDNDDEDEDYNDDFEVDDPTMDDVTKLNIALKKENEKAKKHLQNKQNEFIAPHTQHNYNGIQVSSGPNFKQHPTQLQQSSESKPGMSQPLKKQEGGFAVGTMLIVGERVDHVAANQQIVRAEELRELVDLGQEEFFNMFEMIPQTPQDVYFSKLTAGSVKTAIVSCSDDLIDKDIQTEDLGAEDKFNQASEDIMTNYNKNKNQYQRKKKRDNEALNLEKFMSRAGPVVEQAMDENEQLFFLNNREQAQKRNAVELKSTLKFPNELLHLYSKKGQPAKLDRVTCLHMFESSPQSKCAVSYRLETSDDESVNLIIVFSVTANQILRIFRCEAEVSQMCTPGDDTILLAGTIVGSINLFDLKDYQTSGYRLDELDYNSVLKSLEPNAEMENGDTNIDKKLRDLKSQFSIYHPTFSTDGLANYFHFSPIRRLIFVTKFGGSTAQVGVIDELLTISTWSVIEIQPHIAEKMNDFDLNMSIGGRYKLLQNFSENLMYMPEVIGHQDDIQDISQSLELEFDSSDPNIFYFSCSVGLFKLNRRESATPIKMDTTGMSAPTALSLSDKGYLLVGFSCGSIAMYHQSYTSPITVWYHVCNYAITQIKWCLLYFYDDGQSSGSPSKIAKGADTDALSNVKFATRLCEFFAIDQSEDFLIWNLQKNIHKPAHVIRFSEKHLSNPNNKQYQISMTCPDQSFFTAFALQDNSVNLYLMNFKKGSQITKEKLKLENKKSLKILTMLPMNMLGEDDPLR